MSTNELIHGYALAASSSHREVGHSVTTARLVHVPMHRMPRQRCNEAARRALRAAWPRLDVLPVEPVVAFVSVRRCLSIARRCRAIVASERMRVGSACITNACFMRSRCTSMPQKRKCGMRRRFAKQCLHAGFYSLKVLTGYADRVRIMRPGAPGRICMVAPSFSTARTRIQRFAIAVDARSRTARTLRSVCLSTDETLTPF